MKLKPKEEWQVKNKELYHCHGDGSKFLTYNVVDSKGTERICLICKKSAPKEQVFLWKLLKL